jgi:hypothetical protein
MTSDEIQDLRRRVDKLTRLLDADEQGLMTWSGMVNDAWFDVVEWAPSAALARLLDA